MSNSFSESDAEQGAIEPVIEQLEKLVIAAVDQLRQRPAVAGALLAVVVGAVIGSMIATALSRRHTSPEAQVSRQTRTAVDAGSLAAGAFKLLENPLVRSFLFSLLARGLKRRFS